MEAKTLAEIFFASIAHDLDRHVMFKRGTAWQIASSRQYYGYVTSLARTFRQWGIQKGDRVAILSENRPEWMIADFACVCSGIVDVPIYATLTAEQTGYLLSHSGARVAFVSTLEQLRKVQSLQHKTSVEKIVVMDDIAEINVIPMWSILDESSPEDDVPFNEQAHKLQPDDIATLIYTSGTTGTSKGVMLSHGNLTSNAVTASSYAEWIEGELYLSFLPLAHVTARHLDYVCFYNGITIAYCPFFDQLPQMLQAVQPTIIVSVPRVYEKVRQEIERKAAFGIKKKILDWALQVGELNKGEIMDGKQPASPAWKMAEKLVYSKVRKSFGGRGRVYYSGG